ncbi:iron transporter [Natronorubrum aibiense]|uniref:DUF7350 domain-containing protein n=1 Tax=Natronorubrum aibiense TaxID=348826 RepID=A0A5P9P7L4_9EURY|nr:iron transporter [Natronorubrum aibiense]QFU83790.1 hypothetical protein GCU68_15220 [Natronorubrum aibiense]
MYDPDLDRRTFVRRVGAATGAIALAGCLEPGADDEVGDGSANDSSESAGDAMPRFPEIDDRPAAVYRPTHRESMRVLEPITAGEYTLAPMLSYPHPFWLVTGGDGEDEIERVDPEQGRGVHLMVTLWDAERGIVLPVDSSATITVFRDGERVGAPRSPWPMLSQEMGFHFGDNVPLADDGTYTVEIEIPPVPTRTTGSLEGRFTDRETATFKFTYDQAFRDQVVGGVEYFDESVWGEPGALKPMGHGGVPYSALPPAEEYPGTRLEATDGSDTDLPRSGDAAILVTLLESGSRLAAGDDRYLLVSPRTPYNRVPLAAMAIRATVERDGEPVDGANGIALEETIDGEYDHHYGASFADIRPGDAVTIEIESPPQVARHRGYETAFLEMPPIDLAVPEGPDR